MTTKTEQTLAIGVDLGGTKVETALVDNTGRIVSSKRQPTHAEKGADGISVAIVAAVQSCLAEAAAPVCGVGVGVAGQVDGTSGMVYAAPNLGWHNVPLKERLEQALALPVKITNDVRAAAWGEWCHGAGQGLDDLVCMFVGTGVGGAVISAGRMVTGCSNTAGELGHTVLVYNGRKCTCPNSGCLEAYAGGWAIAERAKEAIRDNAQAGSALVAHAGGIDEVTAATVGALAEDGHPLARRLMDETAQYLGAGLAGVINAVNPCLVVLGGGVIEGSPQLIQPIADAVRSRALRAAVHDLRFAKAQLGNNAGVVGAAALARAN